MTTMPNDYHNLSALAPAPVDQRPALIELKQVGKTYDSGSGPTQSIADVSFDIKDGEFVSIVGPSGCGKSTLLKMVAGLLPISSGELTLSGSRIAGPQQNVGIVFQSAVLLAWRNVLDNILLQAEMRNLPMAAARQRAMSLIEMAIAFGEGKVLAGDVRAMLGTLDHGQVFDLLQALIEGDAR